MNPPAIARLLLLTVASEAEFEYISGDLHEEFVSLCATHGRRAGRRWYASQVLRSVISLWGLRMRKGEIAHVVVAAGLGIAMPLLLLDRLWSFVYSLIPLKESLHRSPALLAVNIVCACVLAALCGATAGSFRRALAIATAAAAAVVSATWASVGETPGIYLWTLSLAAPASTLAAFQIHRVRLKRSLV